MGGQPLKNEKKLWYKSTTVWLNTVPLVALVLDTVLQTNVIKDKDVLAILVALLNILNRARGLSLK